MQLRHALVTGASRGIGAAIARRLLACGHRVVGIARHAPEHGEGLADMQFLAADLTNPEAAADALRELADTAAIDTLVCNAGRGDIRSLENFSIRQICDSLQLNLISPLALTRTCLPGLRQHSRSDIVFIGSESALAGGRYGSVYSAAKFGLRGAAQALRHECAGANCHVGIVHPGMVRTGFFDTLGFEPGGESSQALCADDVATAVLSMIDAPDNAVIDEITLTPLQRVVRKKSQPKRA